MTATVEQHFARADPAVRETYDRLLAAAQKLGEVHEEAKKTSIHLVRSTAFAGVATRRTALILTIKSAEDIANPRVMRREQASANRWHVEIKLETPAQVDREVVGWLKRAYALSG